MPRSAGDNARCIECGLPYLFRPRTARICAACSLRRARRPSSAARGRLDASTLRPAQDGRSAVPRRPESARLVRPAGSWIPPSLAPDIALTHEPCFIESSLPRTIASALKHKARILAELTGTDKAWPFPDRVLVWLAEHWRTNVDAHHCGRGPTMADKFDGDQLEHLDEHYYEALRSRLDEISAR